MSAARRGDTPLATLRQSLGRMPLLLRNMEPTWFLDGLARITPDFVAREGITGILWDIDGTLTAYHRTTLLPEAVAPFEALRGVPGLAHAILSNAPEWRFRELAGMFPDLPVFRGYRLGDEVLLRRLQAGQDSWTADELEDRLAAGAVTLRKPSAELVRLAIGALGCPPAAAVMVGDQFLTDVAGANLAGIRSIKLPNPARSTFPWSIRFTQALESLLYRVRPRAVPTSSSQAS
ncbi:MAG: HAD hydrolase-like protein [Gemmatimonadales bacterium]|nr:HAD hydrolase-like protein [Gemmatimonadales bacterium]